MFTALNEVFLLATQDPQDMASLHPRIAEAVELMVTELPRHAPSSRWLAVKLSPSRFAHLFTEEVGSSPIRAPREIQQRQAMLRPSADEAIKTIARLTRCATTSTSAASSRAVTTSAPRLPPRRTFSSGLSAR